MNAMNTTHTGRLQNLTELIEAWGEQRFFYDKEHGTTAVNQIVKLVEELGEFCQSYSKSRDVKDDIGDQYVVLTHIAKLLGISLASIFDKIPDGLPAPLKNYIDGIEKIPETKKGPHMILFLLSAYNSLANICQVDGTPASFIERQFAEILFGLNVISVLYETNLPDCVEVAYDEIKDRKGKMVNRIYVKENDL